MTLRTCIVLVLIAVGVVPVATASAAPVVSSNWSGYAVTQAAGRSASFSSVSGSWIEPAATCTPGQETFAGVWVGLGGYSEHAQALEQIGTDADCTRRGRALYSTWFELVPALPVSIQMTIHPGDELVASVTVKDRHATLRIRDLTSGASFSTTRHLAAVDVSSAEWIVEAPSSCLGSGGCATLPLTDFGTVDFLAATATTAGHTGTIGDASFLPTALELHDGSSAFVGNPRQPIAASRTLATATPSALGSGGSFSVTWGTTQSQPTAPGGEGSPALSSVLRRKS